jgi:hypothetical protein
MQKGGDPALQSELMIILTLYLVQMEAQTIMNTPLLPLYVLSTLSECPIIRQLGFFGCSVLSAMPKSLR